ncbi:VCBS repeat-containing protein, partial [Candidatus Sumerlaeota bacterium]|nr:VCBS repeat-containing protein [Candidatus Sumerlaeota bacterium]
DINRDGKVDIVALRITAAGVVNGLIAFHGDGSFLAQSESVPAATTRFDHMDSITIANLIIDPSATITNPDLPEIIVRDQVFRLRPNSEVLDLLWKGGYGQGTNPAPIGPADSASGSFPAVADVNMDGSPDLVTGNTVYNADGSVQWSRDANYLAQRGLNAALALPDGFVAVANFDDDPNPEIAVVSNPHTETSLIGIIAQFYTWTGEGRVRVIDHDGSRVLWDVAQPANVLTQDDPFRVVAGSGIGGAPAISDFNNDGLPDVGVGNASAYSVYLGQSGRALWTHPALDASSAFCGSSAFDFNADGRAEVVYSAEYYLRVMDGATGEEVARLTNYSGTLMEYPTVADVDGDHQAEILTLQTSTPWGFGQAGLYVYGGRREDWAPTRPVWNQAGYHITNVNNDGTIPAVEQNNWEIYNSYRQNELPKDQTYLGGLDLTASKITVNQSLPPSASVSVRIGNAGLHDTPLDPAPRVGVYLRKSGESELTLAGLSRLTRSLSQGDFEDVTVNFQAPGDGDFDVIAEVNDTKSLPECRFDNNAITASSVALETTDTSPPLITLLVNPNALDVSADPHKTAAITATITDDFAVELSRVELRVKRATVRDDVTLTPSSFNRVVQLSMPNYDDPDDFNGVYEVEVVASDVAGHDARAAATLTITGGSTDNNDPTATLTLPSVAEVGEAMNVLVQAADADSGLASIVLFEGASDLRGTRILPTVEFPSGTASVNVTLPRVPTKKDPAFEYRLVVTDRAGRTASVTKTVEVKDTRGPAISFNLNGSQIADGSTTGTININTNSTLHFRVDCSDAAGIPADPKGSHFELSRGAQTVPPFDFTTLLVTDYNTDFNVNPGALGTGLYRARVTSEDVNGNISTFTCFILVAGDITPPQIHLYPDPGVSQPFVVGGQPPCPGALFGYPVSVTDNDELSTVTFTASLGSTLLYSVSVNDGGTTSAAHTFYHRPTQASAPAMAQENRLRLTFTAYDKSGNSATVERWPVVNDCDLAPAPLLKVFRLSADPIFINTEVLWIAFTSEPLATLHATA